MPTDCSSDSLHFGTSAGRQLVGAFDGGAITSNGGVLLLGAADRAIRLTDRVAGCFRDLRAPEWIVHPLENLIRQRVYGLALAYEDLVDHDHLRYDPALSAALGRPEGVLAGKSTLNRLEHAGKIGEERNHKIDHNTSAFERLFVDLFLDSYREPRSFMVIDLDATEDQLKAVSDVANTGWNLQANADTASKVAPGDTVQFINGDNIEITRNGNDITVATAKALTVDSITAGDRKAARTAVSQATRSRATKAASATMLPSLEKPSSRILVPSIPVIRANRRGRSSTSAAPERNSDPASDR